MNLGASVTKAAEILNVAVSESGESRDRCPMITPRYSMYYRALSHYLSVGRNDGWASSPLNNGGPDAKE
jgi:hypothetical protein